MNETLFTFAYWIFFIIVIVNIYRMNQKQDEALIKDMEESLQFSKTLKKIVQNSDPKPTYDWNYPEWKKGGKECI